MSRQVHHGTRRGVGHADHHRRDSADSVDDNLGDPFAFGVGEGPEFLVGTPEVSDLLRKQGVDVVAGTPEQFATAIRTDIDKWARIVKEAGIRAE